MIQITTIDGDRFDLSEDFTISVEENSVMLGKEGAFSLPLDLPWTDHNVSLIKHPSRIDRREKFTSSIEVTVSAGAWVRQARLDIESAQEEISISGSLFFRESKFYRLIDEVSLPDIFMDVNRDDYSNLSDIEQKIEAWLTYFEKIQTGEIQDDFFVFPVCAEKEHIEEDKEQNGFKLTVIHDSYTILNRPDVPTKFPMTINDVPTSNYPGTTAVSASGKTYYKLAAHKKWTFTLKIADENSLITHQKGYGVTPFLKFSYILQYLFQYFGYTLTLSDFTSNPAFAKLCYINNTADAIMDGVINYAQLVPDKTVIEFLEHVENSFGVEFIFNEIDNTVYPLFWKDLIIQTPSQDIDNTFEDYPVITYSVPKSVRISTGKSAVEDKMLYDTYNNFFRKYQPMPAGTIPLGTFFYVFEKSDLSYMCYLRVHLPFIGEANFPIEKVPSLMNYYDDTYEALDKDCGFESVPLVQISLDGKSRLSIAIQYTTSWILGGEDIHMEDTTAEDSVLARIPFIKTIRHLKTVKAVTAFDSSGGKENISEKKETESGDELDIFPCFYHGFALPYAGAPGVERTFFASQFRYNNIGTALLAFDMSTLSLYETFWKNYDEITRSSFHEIAGPAYLSEGQLLSLKMHEIYKLKDQDILPESIQYEITNDGINVVEFKIRTLKKYQ